MSPHESKMLAKQSTRNVTMSEYPLRRAASILRQLGPLVQGGEWTPHIPVTSQDNLVYTSQFRAANQTIWLLVNRCCRDRIVVKC